MMQDDKVIVFLKDNKYEPTRFGSENAWGREQLQLLDVDFYMQRWIDLNKVLNMKERKWSPAMKAHIDPNLLPC